MTRRTSSTATPGAAMRQWFTSTSVSPTMCSLPRQKELGLPCTAASPCASRCGCAVATQQCDCPVQLVSGEEVCNVSTADAQARSLRHTHLYRIRRSMLSWMLPPSEFSIGTTALSALHCEGRARARRRAGPVLMRRRSELTGFESLTCRHDSGSASGNALSTTWRHSRDVADLRQRLEHELEAVAGDVLPLRTRLERCLRDRHGRHLATTPTAQTAVTTPPGIALYTGN